MPDSTVRFFNDFEAGEVLVSAERTLTAQDITTFANLTEDHNPLHMDDAFAATGPYGRRIAHGLLVQSIASGLAVNDGALNGTAVGLRNIECKLSLPVFLDDTIHVEMIVVEKKPLQRLGVGNVSVQFRVINQEGQTVQKGIWQILVKLKK